MVLGGSNVKVCPSVVMVVGLVTGGKEIVLLPVPVLLAPGEADDGGLVCPSDSVTEVGSSVPDDDIEDGGRKVKVLPSVVRVVGDVTDGTVTVLVPMTITVCPSDLVNVVGFWAESDDGEDDGGKNVNVCPIVVRVVG